MTGMAGGSAGGDPAGGGPLDGLMQGQPAGELHSVMRGVVRRDEPLRRHTTIRIGGPAALYAVPDAEADVVVALQWACARGMPWRVLGLGSNLLCPDAGFAGLALSLERACGGIRFEGTTVEVGAGVHLAPLIQAAAARGLSGLEGVAGVPGTVGGAVAMNAGTASGEMGAAVRSVRALTADGRILEIPAAQMRFGYRRSRLQEEGLLALGAVLELRPTDAEAVRRDLRARAVRRRTTQPLELPNSGSIWRNPVGDFAGRLIEAAGCKGRRRGDAQVSPKHANFIVNLGRARAADVIGLMAEVRAEVEARFGTRLEPELCWLLGREALLQMLDDAAAGGSPHPGDPAPAGPRGAG